MNSQIDAYIKQAKASGQTDEQIKKSLLQSGWSQEQVNEAFGVPNPQGNVTPPPPPPPQFKLPQNDYTKFDEKTIATIKASAIWNGVAGIITSLAGTLAVYYFTKNLYGGILGNYLGKSLAPKMINMGLLISDVIWAVIWGAVAGWVISKFYPVFVGWQQKYLGNKLNSFFKLLFWPYVVGIVAEMVLSGALSTISSRFNIFIVVALADLVAVFIYAKMMDKAVGKYYL